MIQRQLYIYLMLVMSITLNLFQIQVPQVRAAGVVESRQLQIPVLEEAAPVPVMAPSAGQLVPSSPASEIYEMDVVMDYGRHFVTVEETITYPNQTGVGLDYLTLAVAANLFPDCFDLIRLSVDHVSVSNFDLDGHRLRLPLPTPLEPDSQVQLSLRFTLFLPYLDRFNSIDAPVFGYTDVQTNLINWYPFVVPFVNGEWVLHDPLPSADYLVYPIADYKVNLVFVGEASAPIVASSGSAEEIEAFTRYSLQAGRSFSFAMSPEFEVASMKTGETMVFSYYLPGYRNPAEAAMRTSAEAIEVFTRMFGGYSHSTFSIIQADLSDSREFSAGAFVSRNFYQLYDGTSKNSLSYASAHAAAHQWWFEQVGNDQALQPWLDESLATYSESLYFENMDPKLQSYWKKNRVDFFRPRGNINASIYDEASYDVRQSAYLNGVSFLIDLRAQVGDYAFRKFLGDYYQQGRGKIVTQEDFFHILEEHTEADLSYLIHQYFETP